MKTDTPLVCNMDVFTLAQREAHIVTTTMLMQSIQGVREVQNGYEFTFPGQPEFISRIAEFISNERACCPFLKFGLTVFPDGEPITLSLTGPAGTQEFLRIEFDGAIP
jgi:hypothetical protein